MSILVSGAGGQLGQELAARAGARRLVGLPRAEWNIADPGATERVLDAYLPTLVINAAAYTAVDRAEAAPGPAFAANRDGPGHLARACARRGIALLHLSTCYVFDGAQRTPYAEGDAPAPLNVYGRSKLEGEAAVRDALPRHLILRVSWVFGAHGENFVRTLLRRAQAGAPLRVVADQTGTPTHAGDIAQALLQLADRITAGEDLPWGLYHYPGGEAVSWHAFAEAIMAEACRQGLLDHAPSIAPITSAEYPSAARRPAYSVLDGRRGAGLLGLPPADWRAGLKEVLSTWKQAA